MFFALFNNLGTADVFSGILNADNSDRLREKGYKVSLNIVDEINGLYDVIKVETR